MNKISAIELREKLAQHSDTFLLDVRELYEHEEFNIGGTLIPLDDVMMESSKIPKDKPVIVYCKKGVRSQIAIQRLERKGFANLINLEGGLEAFKKTTL